MGRDIRAAAIALITEAYELGPDSPEMPLWPEGPHDEPWTQPEAVTAYQFTAALLLNALWQADTAQRGGDPFSPVEFLAMNKLMITLSASGDPVAELARIAGLATDPPREAGG
ncbi:MAG TPA: hypothetical protein VGF32_30560 [Streptosporangiaceae bacterium]|jgi:hypothetical protein